jgi:Retrotransposon gag protein
MKPVGTQVEEVMWKLFHVSLEGKALEWYKLLATYDNNAYASWENLRRSFLNKYFPESKVSIARKEISTVEQHKKEPLLDYLNRFQEFLYRCPNHQYSEENLVIYFCNGLLPKDADHLDASANGSITKLDVEAAWSLIKEVAIRKNNRRRVDEDDTEKSLLQAMMKKMEQMTKRIEELEAERNNKTDYKVCNAIMSYDEEEVSAIDYQRGNPYENNRGWNTRQYYGWENSNTRSTLENKMAKMEDKQNNLEAKVERLEDYIREHTNSVATQLTQMKGEMPSTTVINPKCVKSLTL